MENLFLEILRVLDFNYHKKNTDFYFFTLHYYRLIVSNNKITKDSLLKIVEEIVIGNESLFLASKVDGNEEYSKKIKVEINSLFLASRDIIFYICYFLNFIVKKDNDFDLSEEKDFFNIKDDFIESFKNIINYLSKKESILNIVNIFDNINEMNRELIKSFLYDSDFDIKKFSSESKITNELNTNFSYSLLIYLKSKDIDKGIKTSLDYNFNVSLFYIMLKLISSDINKINLVKIYNNLNYLL